MADTVEATLLENKLLAILAEGPQGIANLAGATGLGKEYNNVFKGGKKQNNGSFKAWLISVPGVQVIPDESLGGRYCVCLDGQETERPADGNKKKQKAAGPKVPAMAKAKASVLAAGRLTVGKAVGKAAGRLTVGPMAVPPAVQWNAVRPAPKWNAAVAPAKAAQLGPEAQMTAVRAAAKAVASAAAKAKAMAFGGSASTLPTWPSGKGGALPVGSISNLVSSHSVRPLQLGCIGKGAGKRAPTQPTQAPAAGKIKSVGQVPAGSIVRPKPKIKAEPQAAAQKRALAQATGPAAKRRVQPGGMKAKEEPLPPGWEQHFDDTFKMHYYWNKDNDESRWERPE